MVQEYVKVQGVWRRLSNRPTTGEPPDPPGNTTPWLPFERPSLGVLRASPKKFFPHYFTPFPLAIDNIAPPNDWYSQRWIPQAPNPVEGGTDWAAYGGRVRDRKPKSFLGTRPRPGNWQVLDKFDTDVTQCYEAGFDGFIFDHLQNAPNQRWIQAGELIDAMTLTGDNTFKWIPMPDGNTSGTNTAANVVATLGTEKLNPQWYKHAGSANQLIAPYIPEHAPNAIDNGSGPSFWSSVKSLFQSSQGMNVDLWNCYTELWTSAKCAPAFDAIPGLVIGHGRWGDRDPNAIGNANNQNRGAAAFCHSNFGKLWLAPIAWQDVRCYPGQLKVWEAGGFDALRASWSSAMQTGTNAPDLCQGPTWDDLSENAQICVTEGQGYAVLDQFSYYNAWMKTGVQPAIVRDCIYLAHRKHHRRGGAIPVTFTGPQVNFVVPSGSTPYREEVDATFFLVTAASVEITSGTQTTVQSLPAGITSVKVPLNVGTVSAKIVRGTSTIQQITSPTVVSDTQWGEDATYKTCSSLRG